MADPDTPSVVYKKGGLLRHTSNTVKILSPGEQNALIFPRMPYILLKSPECWTIH